jgi:hypothetical protein
MSDLSPWQTNDIRVRPAEETCPRSDSWQHADIADSLGFPVGTLLLDSEGPYCPACDYRPERDEAAN